MRNNAAMTTYDGAWLKRKILESGRGTRTKLAAELGVRQSTVSKILSGERQIKGTELLPILAFFGEPPPHPEPSSYQVPDVVPFDAPANAGGAPGPIRQILSVADTFGAGHQVHLTRVGTDCLASLGYMPGDFALVDYRDPEAAPTRSIVVAQVENPVSGEWHTVLRRLLRPVLAAASPNPEHLPYVIDDHVQLRGVVVASWRLPATEPELIEGRAAKEPV